MPSLRQEITKTFRRLSRRDDSSRESAETIVRPDPREGQQLGAYRILKRLGTGGMGHVYLALDTRLGRHVALKFLSPELVSDPAMLHHLEQEARTVSALNHPNILTIYEIGASGDDHFIAGEFVDGATLRNAMQRWDIDPGTAIDIATQIASALTAAHAAGIVHRDLKPGNVIIRPDALVKVIDFGLAKRIKKPEQPQADPSWTGGSLVGTVDYMSPEQARGDEVDHRTDLWSLGVLLYEMVAHRRPFEGDTESHVIVAILDQPVPPLPDTKPDTVALAKIVRHALTKDRAKRYQTANEMLADLHSISHVSRPGSSVRLAAVARRNASRKKLYALVLVLALLLLVFTIRRATRAPDWFQPGAERQLTYNGRTSLAAISPDGRYLAYVVGDQGGMQSLCLKQIASSSGTEEIKIAPRKIEYLGITFSPDSQQILEVEEDESLFGKLYAMPIVGPRPSVPILVDIDGPVSFSPDGDRFAFVRYLHPNVAGRDQTESAVYIASRDNPGTPQKLLSVKSFTMSRRLAWSPKGNLIAAFLYNDLPGRAGETMLDLISARTGTLGREAREPLAGWLHFGQAAWSRDGSTLIVSATAGAEDGNHTKLREIDAKTVSVHEITEDLAGYKSAGLTADGEGLAAVKIEPKATLWISERKDLSRGEIAPAEAEQHTSLSWIRENELVINSERGGFPNLWLFDVATQSRSALISAPYIEQDAASAPGTQSIVFASNRSGQFHLWSLDPVTRKLTQLTFGPNYDEHPSISPDGRWILYTSWSSTTPHLRRVGITGENNVEIGTFLARDGQVSPDGTEIVCQMQYPKSEKWNVAVIPIDGSGSPQIVENARSPFHWSPNGKDLTTVITDARGVSNLWQIPLDGSEPAQLTRFDEDTILAFSWSPSGDRLACVRASFGSDVVLFSRRKR